MTVSLEDTGISIKEVSYAAIAALHRAYPQSEYIELGVNFIMGWFSKKKTSDNKLGEYLPDEDAQPYEQSEKLGAISEPDAQEKCEETAAEYGGTEPKVKPTDRDGRWDCTFKLWG